MTKFRTQVARDWQIGLKDNRCPLGMVHRAGRPVLDLALALLRRDRRDGPAGAHRRRPDAGAQFFPNARINYAENLLRFSRGIPRDAIVFWGEDKVKRRLAHAELWDDVARLAQ